LRKELELYNPELLGKPAIVFANKSDLNSGKESMRKLKALVKKMKLNIFYGSADKGDGFYILI
jgi:GTPase involved in cell partitioning and DNA repair